jgi:NTP pyrophosphatase (non-canonical NTP hydrolase)
MSVEDTISQMEGEIDELRERLASTYSFSQYQEEARSTYVYPEQFKILYPALGLAEEAGEVAGKVKKTIRDFNADFYDEDRRKAIALELGDALWYIFATANDLGFTLEDIAKMNVEKLRARRARGNLHGEGDNR